MPAAEVAKYSDKGCSRSKKQVGGWRSWASCTGAFEARMRHSSRCSVLQVCPNSVKSTGVGARPGTFRGKPPSKRGRSEARLSIARADGLEARPTGEVGRA